MKEQLITFKTAKLAKEKGFDAETLYFWTTGKKPYVSKGLEYMSECYCKSNWNNGIGSYPTKAEDVEASAPTQSLLQKWLREVHEIDVNVLPYNKNKKYYEVWVEKANITWSNFSTYEEALEIGLQEALKLIK